MNCSKCGKEVHPSNSFCEHCGASLERTAPTQPVQNVTPDQIPSYDQGQPWSFAPPAPGKRENVLLGSIGALAGAVIGGVVIVLVSMMGYVAAISGIVLAFCTLKGYELLGKKLSVKGIIVCVVLMLVTPYIADTVDWVFVIMDAYADYGITFAEAFSLFPLMLEDGAIEMESYISNLLMLYGFTALGAVGIVINTVKGAKNQ